MGLAQYRLDYILPDNKSFSYKRAKILLLVFMIIAFLVAVWLQVANERNNNKITEQVSTLHSQNDSLITLNELTHSEILLLQNQVQHLDSNLSPFIRIAMNKYPNLGIEQALEKLSQEVVDVKEMAKPNTISYSRNEIKKTNTGYEIYIWCKLAKDEPIGTLGFTINLPLKSSVAILDITPIGSAMDVRTSYSENKKTATMSFIPASTGYPGIKILLSDKENFRIIGNKGFGEQIIQIK
jgi:hypothetical protein